MDRTANYTFKFNQETEFVPVLGLLSSQLNAPKGRKSNDASKEDGMLEPTSSIQANHHSVLLDTIAGELQIHPADIHDFELSVQSPVITTLSF